MFKLLKLIYLIVLLLILFQVLEYLPIPLVNEFTALVTVLMLLFVLYYYFVQRFLSRNYTLSKIEVFVLILLFVPFFSAYNAYSTFGQPLIYGILTQRNIWIASSALIFLASLRHGIVTLKELEKILLGIAWTLLGIYFLMSLMFDPESYREIPGVLTRKGVDGTNFRFQPGLIVFGFLYYSSKAVKIKNRQLFFYSIPFLFFLIFVNQARSLLIATLIALLYFIYRWSSLTKLLSLVPKIIIVLAIGISSLYVFKEDFFNRMVEKFDDAFSVVLKGELTKDTSANARIVETNVALPYIKKNWIFGNGDLSNQWENGYRGRLGYFYPSDVGLIGVIYLYGVVGLFFFYYQYLFAIRYSRYSGIKIYDPLTDVSKVYLLYMFLHSFVTGSVATLPAVSLFFIVLLYFSDQVNRQHTIN